MQPRVIALWTWNKGEHQGSTVWPALNGSPIFVCTYNAKTFLQNLSPKYQFFLSYLIFRKCFTQMTQICQNLRQVPKILDKRRYFYLNNLYFYDFVSKRPPSFWTSSQKCSRFCFSFVCLFFAWRLTERPPFPRCRRHVYVTLKYDCRLGKKTTDNAEQSFAPATQYSSLVV